MSPTERSNNYAIWPVLLLLITMISVQGSASLAKHLFPLLGPSGMTAWRLVFSAIMLSLIFKPWAKPINKKAIKPIIIYGLALGFMNLSFYLAIERLPLAIVVAVEMMGPIAVALFASRRLWDFIWLALAVFGLALLLPLHAGSANIDPLGLLFGLMSGLGWFLYIIFGRTAGALHGASSVALGSIISTLLFFPIGIYDNGWALFSVDILPMAFLVAILASAIPYGLEMIALPRLPAQTFSTLMSLSPVLAALSGYLFLGEQLTFSQWIAVACIVASSIGVLLLIRRS